MTFCFSIFAWKHVNDRLSLIVEARVQSTLKFPFISQSQEMTFLTIFKYNFSCETVSS